MFIRLLGTIGAGPDEEQVTAAPGRIPAGVLAHLALESGRAVTSDSLAAVVWDDPPESARNALQVAVSKLRRQHGAELIESSRTGYRLRAELVRIDWVEAQRHVEDATAALDAGRPADAIQAAESALSLFAGEPLSGVESTGFVAARVRADELFSQLRQLQARALMDAGRAGTAVDILRAQVEREPLNEVAHALLMETLAAAGRPADGLAVYDELRHRLADELGADPSPAVQDVFARLLDPAAAPEPELDVAPRRAARVKLPAVGTPLIGRDEELRAARELFASGHRLVTLLGPGGIGKTRLAIALAQQLAAEQSRPAVFVDLTATRRASDVSRLVAGALDVEDADWASALRRTKTLMVLDNAEHVLEAVATVIPEILAVEGTAVLVTSRSPLRLRDERPFPVDVLAARHDDDAGVLLLAERAGLTPGERRADGRTLQSLAQRADGMPLVLELLASAMRWHTPSELLTRLDTVLLELTADERDRPARHFSVAAATEWSLSECTPDARTALGALTVARGSFSLQAAVDILQAASDGTPPPRLLAELADLSLIQRQSDPGRIRFRILEPIRLHAVSSDQVPHPSDAVHRAHARHYLAAAVHADDLVADSETAIGELLRHDEQNLRAALEWAWADDPACAMPSLGAVLHSWFIRDRIADALDWSVRALASDAGRPAERARVALTRLRALLYQHTATEQEMEELSDAVRPHVASFKGEWHRRWTTAQSAICRLRGDIPGALKWLDDTQDSTARDLFRTTILRVELLLSAGRFEEAHDALQRLLSRDELRHDPALWAIVVSGAGYSAVIRKDFSTAAVLLEEARDLARAQDLALHEAMVVNNQGWVALGTGAYQRAVELVAVDEAQLAVLAEDRGMLAEGAVIVGLALHGLGRDDEARMIAAGVAAAVQSAPGGLDAYGLAKLDELTAAVNADTAEAAVPTAAELLDLVRAAGRR